MLSQTELPHQSTLVGAVDSYLKELVHVRPFLMQRYTDVLECMVECWLEEIGINQVAMLDPKWLNEFVAVSTDRGIAMNALQDFYRWALQHQLVVENPISFANR